MTGYDKYFKEEGLRKMPDVDELAELLELIIHALPLSNRQKRIMKALA